MIYTEFIVYVTYIGIEYLFIYLSSKDQLLDGCNTNSVNTVSATSQGINRTTCYSCYFIVMGVSIFVIWTGKVPVIWNWDLDPPSYDVHVNSHIKNERHTQIGSVSHYIIICGLGYKQLVWQLLLVHFQSLIEATFMVVSLVLLMCQKSDLYKLDDKTLSNSSMYFIFYWDVS